MPEGVSGGGESHVPLGLLLLSRSMGGSSWAQGVYRGWGCPCQERSELLRDLGMRFACLCMI